MIPVPSSFIPSLIVALSIIGLGVACWWQKKRSRVTLLFLVLALCMATWVASGWFQYAEYQYSPLFILRLLLVPCLIFAPAFCLHLAYGLENRRFWRAGWLAYGMSFLLTLCGYLAWQSPRPAFIGGFGDLLQIITAFIFPMYVVVFYSVVMHLYPAMHNTLVSDIDRRRHMYGLMVLVSVLVAGAVQLVPQSVISPSVAVTILGGCFFLVAARGFCRVRLFDIQFWILQSILIVLVSTIIVFALRAKSETDLVIGMIEAGAVAAFGMYAVHLAYREAIECQKLEHVHQKHQETDETKNEFVARVTHQLRSPLGGIRFASDMLLNGDYGPLTSGAKGVVELMKHTAERLLALAETSLSAARLDVGAFQPVPAPLDVAREIRSLLDEARLFAQAKGIELRCQTDRLPPRLWVDPEVLRTIVFNLLDNAIKYTDKGYVSVEATVHDGRLQIIVRDTGTGLSAEDKHQLFRRFYNGHSHVTHRPGGIGLGLYVTKRLVEASGGDIQALSDGPGTGAQFKIELPLSHLTDLP